MIRKLYNTFFAFHSSQSEAESSTGNISIFPVETLPFERFSHSTLYQNNQNRYIALITDQQQSVVTDGQPWIFYVEDVVNIYWVNGEDAIRYCMIDPEQTEAMEYWMIHIVIPIFLTMRRELYFLHAGSVLIEDRLIAFMAPSFGGKSTLTNYFLQQNHPLVTDDKLGTFERDGVFYGVPSHPYHRPYRNPEDLGLKADSFGDGEKEITAIYMLEKSAPDGQIMIHELKGIEKFTRLHEGSEMNFFMMNREFVRYLSKLANGVRVFNITVPHDLARLDEVYQSIKHHTLEISK